MLKTEIYAYETRRSEDGQSLTRRVHVDTGDLTAQLRLSLEEPEDPEVGYCLLRVTGSVHDHLNEEIRSLGTKTHGLPLGLSAAGYLLAADGRTELRTNVLNADDALSLAVHVGTCGLLTRKEAL